MDKRIAVIGISFRFPDTNNMNELHWNLIRKKNSIRCIDSERKKLLGTDKDFDMAFLSRIDEFDNDFFGISNREAKSMSPQMRISLEQAAKAVWDAGYSLSYLRGKNCGVIVTQNQGSYKNHLSEYNAFSFIGNSGMMTAGNIAYRFDLRGPNMQIASTCSSSLMSVHEAAVKLYTNQADLMLVGGAEIFIPDKAELDEMDALSIISDKPECIPFSDKASGTHNGEGAAFILLKRYEDAVRDNDSIYGCIVSTAVNSNGSRSGNLTAPSAEAETEVIKKAWAEGGVLPSDITEIETHGTATKIGDPIEINGIINCLDGKEHIPPIYLGSVKSNIGHTISVAAMASLIKVICGFENNVCYPICGLENFNSELPFSEKSVMPLKEPVFYSRNEERTAGVSAYGFSGNNVHLVIRNVKHSESSDVYSDISCGIMKISVKDNRASDNYIKEICTVLSSGNVNADDLVYTMNTGRDDYGYRAAICYSSKEDLIQKLSCVRMIKASESVRAELCIILGSSDNNMLSTAAALLRAFASAGIVYNISEADEVGKLITEIAVSPDSNYGISDVIEKLSSENAQSAEQTLFTIKIGGKTVDLTSDNALYEAVKVWYLSGGNVNWNSLYKGESRRRIHLPCDIFVRKKFWGSKDGFLDECITGNQPKVNTSVKTESFNDEAVVICKNIAKKPDTAPVDVLLDGNNIPAAKTAPEKENNEDIRTIILSSWRKALDNQSITEEDSFFEFGGNSLTAMMIIDELNAKLGAKLTVEDFYIYDTIKQLAEYIEG